MRMYSVQTSETGKIWVTIEVRYTLDAALALARERFALYQKAIGSKPKFRICEIPDIDDDAEVIEILEYAPNV